jgi:hypothetical protein
MHYSTSMNTSGLKSQVKSEITDAHSVYQEIKNLADDLGYSDVSQFSAAVTPYYSIWTQDLKKIFDGLGRTLPDLRYNENLSKIMTQGHTVEQEIEGLFDVDRQIYLILSDPMLHSITRAKDTRNYDGQDTNALSIKSTELKQLLVLIIEIQQSALYFIQIASTQNSNECNAINLDSTAQSSDVPQNMKISTDQLEAAAEACNSTYSAAMCLSNIESFWPIFDPTTHKRRGELIASIRKRYPALGISESEEQRLDANQWPVLGAIVSYADVLRKRVASALELMEIFRQKLLDDIENEPSATGSTENEIYDSSQPAIEDLIHNPTKHDKVNKTLMVLDMLTMHNFRKLPSVAQLRTLEYEASSVTKDFMDSSANGETPSKLDNMMEAFVRQCWRRRSNVFALNANPLLLQLCLDFLLLRHLELKGSSGGKDMKSISTLATFSLTARESVALGVLAILLRYPPNVDKIDSDKLVQVLMLILSPGSASTGLDLIRAFACAQGLARTSDPTSLFAQRVVDFALNHISSKNITWGLAAEICGFLSALCRRTSEREYAGHSMNRILEISSAVITTLDHLAVPVTNSRVSSLVLCEYCVRALQTLSNLSPDITAALVRAHGVELLLRVILRCPTRPLVQAECAAFVLELIVATNRAQMCLPSAPACVEGLLDTIRQPRCDTHVLDGILRALAALTFQNEALSQQVRVRFVAARMTHC